VFDKEASLVLIAITALSFLVLIHEFGHFIVAKMTGVKVNEFNLGFGPKIFHRQIGETTYGVSIILAGGYVKMAGMGFEEEVSPEDEPRSFAAQPVWKRISVVAAGPLMNLFLGIFLFWFLFLVIGVPFFPNIVDTVQAGSPAYKAGIRTGDKIISVAGHSVSKADEIIELVKTRPQEKVTIQAVRDGNEIVFKPTLGKWHEKEGFGNGRKRPGYGFYIEGNIQRDERFS
jgi:regulator of sigma E protease